MDAFPGDFGIHSAIIDILWKKIYYGIEIMYSKRTRSDYRSVTRRKWIFLVFAILIAAGAVTAAVIPFSSKIKNGAGGQRKEILRLWDNGSYDRVFNLCGSALELNPTNYFMLTMRGFSAYQLGISRINNLDAAHYFDECVESLRRAMLQKDSANDGRLYYVLGKAYSYKGESFSNLAVRYLEKARELLYSAADIPEYLGMAYASMGDYRSSVEAFSEALDPREGEEIGFSKQNPPGLLLLSIARSYLALNEYDQARAYLTRCIEVSPDSNITLQAKLMLAQALKNMGDTGVAIIQLTEILAELGDIAEVHFQLGELYFEMGDNTRARAEWRLALRADPAHAGARMRLSL